MNRLPALIETPRLQLRVFGTEDAEAHYREVIRSKDHLSPWATWADEYSYEMSLDFCKWAKDYYRVDSSLIMGLWLKNKGQLVGTMDARDIDWSLPSAEVGYWGSVPSQGRGYISEALKGLGDHFINEMHFVRLWLTCDALNIASQRVALHAGFAQEGKLVHARRNRNGQLSDTLVFARVSTSLVDK